MSGQSDAQLKEKLAVRWIEIVCSGSVDGRRRSSPRFKEQAEAQKLKHSEVLH
jgi:hypothetical protein